MGSRLALAYAVHTAGYGRVFDREVAPCGFAVVGDGVLRSDHAQTKCT